MEGYFCVDFRLWTVIVVWFAILSVFDIVFVFAVGLWVGQLLYYDQMSPKVKMEETKGASEVATGVDEDQRKLFVGGLAQVFIWSCLYSKSQDDRTCLQFVDFTHAQFR